MTDAILSAFRQALDTQERVIEQVDAELCEDGRTVMLYGYTNDPDVTFVAALDVAASIEWRRSDGGGQVNGPMACFQKPTDPSNVNIRNSNI